MEILGNILFMNCFDVVFKFGCVCVYVYFRFKYQIYTHSLTNHERLC